MNRKAQRSDLTDSRIIVKDLHPHISLDSHISLETGYPFSNHNTNTAMTSAMTYCSSSCVWRRTTNDLMKRQEDVMALGVNRLWVILYRTFTLAWTDRSVLDA